MTFESLSWNDRDVNWYKIWFLFKWNDPWAGVICFAWCRQRQNCQSSNDHSLTSKKRNRGVLRNLCQLRRWVFLLSAFATQRAIFHKISSGIRHKHFGTGAVCIIVKLWACYEYFFCEPQHIARIAASNFSLRFCRDFYKLLSAELT